MSSPKTRDVPNRARCSQVASDKIELVGMVFYGFHGVAVEEQSLGQRFIVDIDVSCDLSKPAASDDVRDTINYSDLYKLTRDIVEGPSRNLLENVAESIATAVLDRFEVDAIRVKVKKPEVPMKGSILDYAAVEIVRKR